MKKLIISSLLFASAAQAEMFYFPTLESARIQNSIENAQAFCSINGYSYAEFSDSVTANPYEELVYSVNADNSVYKTMCIVKSENCDVISFISCQ